MAPGDSASSAAGLSISFFASRAARFAAPARLFQAVLGLGDCRTGALLVELATRCTADANGADRRATGHDRDPTNGVGDVGQRRLWHRRCSSLAHALGDGFGAVLLARKRQ